VSVSGYGQAGVSPKDRRSEASILQAVAAAQPSAVRPAVRDARAQLPRSAGHDRFEPPGAWTLRAVTGGHKPQPRSRVLRGAT
jgi:hypothetical protein